MTTAFVSAILVIWLCVAFGLRHSVGIIRAGEVAIGRTKEQLNRKALTLVVFTISTSAGMTYVMTQIYFLHQTTLQLAGNM
ncbi:hypothetical protein HOV30_gp233 [Erwinia phage Derbicus]|uniref:Uncharacterized protein n=2 Tax=Derbicusvirus derbicus TaxID=2734104 RepID=A0A482IKG0_9CAUD|nr:hypothetical protein BIZ82_gp234 [Erwinia phage vB_EamM_EarlPhillipIV]YP_009821277.1 hypothetical protein HOV30_gp233 [Erwinia phage Derbicus]ANZ49083.1 hypothetical protein EARLPHILLIPIV_234 [Erwinia phage vB_EamM_EarlPhillipIV]QBP07659.1 hypothetical protein DERBICUS_233 [Erwinia phage Derbicus]